MSLVSYVCRVVSERKLRRQNQRLRSRDLQVLEEIRAMRARLASLADDCAVVPEGHVGDVLTLLQRIPNWQRRTGDVEFNDDGTLSIMRWGRRRYVKIALDEIEGEYVMGIMHEPHWRSSAQAWKSGIR